MTTTYLRVPAITCLLLLAAIASCTDDPEAVGVTGDGGSSSPDSGGPASKNDATIDSTSSLDGATSNGDAGTDSGDADSYSDADGGNDTAIADTSTAPDTSGPVDTGAPDTGAPDTGVVTPPPTPVLGAHALGFHRYQVNMAPLNLPPMTTAATGSTIIVSVGRGALSAFSMTTGDNKNPAPFPQLGVSHAYTNWSSSGTALYGLTAALGGSNHIVTSNTPPDDELTTAAVEVRNGTTITDFKWNEVLAPQPLTSLSVTTTGPATLVAFWWGDAGVDDPKTAVPNNGFTVIDSILEAGALVQCAVAARTVATAGTYNVTWTATPTQGAQLWLVAVQ